MKNQPKLRLEPSIYMKSCRETRFWSSGDLKINKFQKFSRLRKSKFTKILFMVLRQIEIQKFMKILPKLRLGVSINMRAGPEIRFWWSRDLVINKFQEILRLQEIKFIKILLMVLRQIEIQEFRKNEPKLSLEISINIRTGPETRFWWSRDLKINKFQEFLRLRKIKSIKILLMVLRQIEIEKFIKNEPKLSLELSLYMRAGPETGFWWSGDLRIHKFQEFVKLQKKPKNFVHGVTSLINEKFCADSVSWWQKNPDLSYYHV